ncbi:lysoplasmalogenase family protein [Aquimarina algicola]|uniref:Lysoplasmalogenase n=1 Tax=Aquimarina algicola TaxID=2589995 RepID=A0A504J7I0_9FLAO|nr:lysoplasmalogenase family protein [Aquimarina algicola]TPN82101.1 hypothetical protein FHK87_21990 [Aquimarina algicola]
MKIRTLIKIFLVIAGSLCVLSTAMQWPELEFYAKPTTVPLFFMLYWFSVKKIDGIFLMVLCMCFIGDIFLLTGVQDYFIYVLLSNGLCYILLFYFLYKNHKPIEYSNTDIFYLVIFFVLWTLIVYEIYEAISPNMGEIKPYGIIYLIILYFLFTGAVFQYANTRSSQALWFLIAILNFVICDSCYALDMFYINSIEFRIINAIYQLLAVFFLVKFRISSPTSLKLRDLDN